MHTAIATPWTAAVTLLALVLHAVVTAIAGRARARYAIKAPAVTGNEQFERAYRVQMNTIEQMVFFVPALWLCAVLVSDAGAAVAGLVWVIARGLYAIAYLKDPASRGPWAGLSVVAQFALLIAAIAGLVRSLIG